MYYYWLEVSTDPDSSGKRMILGLHESTRYFGKPDAQWGGFVASISEVDFKILSASLCNLSTIRRSLEWLESFLKSPE